MLAKPDRNGFWLMVLAIYVLYFVGVSLLAAAEPTPNRYLITSVTAHDGDTLKCDIHLGLGVVLADQSIRLLGFDAWEISRVRRTVEIDEAELAKGIAARDYLLELLAHGTPYLTPEGRGRDPYGRVLARLTILTDRGQPIDVAEQMIRRGHDRTQAPPQLPGPAP